MTNQTKWAIDYPHSEIAFKAKLMVISTVKGFFTTFEASIYTIGEDFTTLEIDIHIDPSSINTCDEKRDERLKSVDFFDVENHRQITFKSSTMGEANANGICELWGELTMVGVTKNIKLDVEFVETGKKPNGEVILKFKLLGEINRSDWGLVWNTSIGKGNFFLSNEIVIACEIQLTKVDFNNLTMELETQNSFNT